MRPLLMQNFAVDADERRATPSAFLQVLGLAIHVRLHDQAFILRLRVQASSLAPSVHHGALVQAQIPLILKEHTFELHILEEQQA